MQPFLFEDSDGIRKFTDTKIQAQVDAAIARMDDKDKRFIVIGHTDWYGNYKLTAAVKFGDNFSIAAGLYDNWKKQGDLKFEAEVIFMA